MRTEWRLKKCRFLPVFLLICVLFQNLGGEVYYPWKETYIGALEAKAWSGLVFIPDPEAAFAFRLRINKGEEKADGIDLLFLVSEVGPHSPDGQYARVKFDLSLPFQKKNDTSILKKPSSKPDTLTLEWSRKDERTVIGRIRAPDYVLLEVVHYFPFDFRGKYQLLANGQVKGESLSYRNYTYLFWTSQKGNLSSSSPQQELALSFSTEREREVHFVAGVGEEERILNNHIYRYKNKKTIDSLLEEEGERYDKKRVKVEGLYKGVPEAITNNIFWMTLYQNGKHRFYTPAGRQWIFPRPDGGEDDWTIFEWDSFFNALELSIESYKHAEDVIKSVLETQYPNGNIPTWRGRFGGSPDRSQPPVGSYVVLKFFQKSGNEDLLRYAYPYLKRWHAFWKAKKPNGKPRRDGNSDGLLEWGSDEELVAKDVPPWEKGASGKQRAMWESGQDDLPNWDQAGFSEEAGTMTLNCLDLSSLYALDSWCLAQIANILGNKKDYETFLAEYEALKTLINTQLWDENEGFYFDRNWDGRFSRKKAASNFYPLLARIPDEARALRMLRHLLNEKEFWGEYVLPTISRNDPAFKDQQYWRGTIWPPTNYLVYQGLKAYDFDAAAAELAKKSAALFMRSWENFQLCPENFDSRSGDAGGKRYQSWGPLFALIALEEYLDFTPWEGFRFGMAEPESKGKLSRAAIQGRHYDVEISRSSIKLKEEGREVVKTDGAAIFRRFLYSENEVSFEIKSLKKREVKIRFLTKGKYQLLIDGQETGLFEGDSFKIKVPEGEHTVLILRLEKKE